MSRQYAKRDAAFEVWVSRQPVLPAVFERRILREVFEAGWAARKRAVDYALTGATPTTIVLDELAEQKAL